MRFLLDENLPRSLASVLRGLGHDVLVTAESPLRGVADQVLWQICAQDELILVTRDLDFTLPRSSPVPAGILLIRAPSSFTAISLAHLLTEFLKQTDAEELQEHITVIAPGQARSRKL